MDYLKRSQYRPLPSTSAPNAGQELNRPHRTWGLYVLCVVLGVAATIGAMSTWVATQCPTVRITPNSRKVCGSSAQEAIDAGCIFDGMMNMWVSEECYDEELTNEFMAIQDWIYYEDYNATIPITQEQLSQSKIAYGTWEWHEAHCFYSMLKLQRAVRDGRQIQLEVVSEEHTRHCKQVVNVTNYLYDKAQRGGARFDPTGMGTILHPGFPLCIDSMSLIPYRGVVAR